MGMPPPIYIPDSGPGTSTHDDMAGRAGRAADGMDMGAPRPGEHSPLPPGYAANGPCNAEEARTNIEWVLCRDPGARRTYEAARGAGQSRLAAILHAQRHNPNARQSIANCPRGVEELAAQREGNCSGSVAALPPGATVCGAGYCAAGLRCAADARSCIPADAVACGAGHCAAGATCSAQGQCVTPSLEIVQGRAQCGGGRYCDPPSTCHPSGQSCMPRSAMGCGNGYCEAGNVCVGGNRCVPATAAATPGGPGNVPSGPVPCGAGHCRAGQLCHPSGTSCYPADLAVCGSGHCAAGQVCAAGQCVAGTAVPPAGAGSQVGPVEIAAAKYFCDKMNGTSLPGDRCRLAVDPTGRECQFAGVEIRRSAGGGVSPDAANQVCGRRYIRDVLVIAQQARKEAMSLVSFGLDETQCDPARVPQPRNCSPHFYQIFHEHMCVAFHCKYAQ